jgi:hypothetical protein
MKPDRNMKLADLMYGHGSEFMCSLSGRFSPETGMPIAVAYRRIVWSAPAVIRNMIHAAAQNAGEEAANAGFAAALFSSAYLDADGEVLVPPCEAVITQFDRLERHHQEAGFTN